MAPLVMPPATVASSSSSIFARSFSTCRCRIIWCFITSRLRSASTCIDRDLCTICSARSLCASSRSRSLGWGGLGGGFDAINSIRVRACASRMAFIRIASRSSIVTARLSIERCYDEARGNFGVS